MYRLNLTNFQINHSKDEEMKEELAGTTAICVLIKDRKLYCVSAVLTKQNIFFILKSSFISLRIKRATWATRVP
jgi:hypothetical protein